MSLIAEANSRQPKRSIVAQLMKMSFEMRRNSIIEEPKPLKQLLQSYPFLKDCNEVRKLVLLCTYVPQKIKICCIIFIATHMHFLIVVQMIAELSRITNKKDLQAGYVCTWSEQWLPKIVKTIKESTTALNISRMKSILDIEKDLEDKNGIPLVLAMYIYMFTVYYKHTQLLI